MMSQSIAKKNTKSVSNLINSYFNVLLLKEGNNNNIDEVMKAFITARDIACNLKNDDDKKKAFNVISERLKEFSKMSNDSRVLNFIEEFSYDLLIEFMANFSDNYTYEDAYDLESKSEIGECEYECESWEFSSF